MAQPRTRQELYARIQATSKDEFILEEMIRLGFWPREGTMPSDPAEEIRRRGQLERELAALRTESTRLGNIEELRKELLRRRLEESKKKQRETKERRERERRERAAAWKEKKQHAIVFLGRGVSGGLSNETPNVERLSAQGLPVLRTAEEVAKALGVTVPALRFLAFSRPVATTTHYARFQIPKKTGGTRLISAPMPRLKAAQRWILDNVLIKVGAHEAAHGFRDKRSIVTNAIPHVGANVVLNLDLKDFFPSVEYRRVKGLFRALGYGEATATIFALICTEPDIDEVELDKRRYFVARGPRRLPQGAPTSPAITNLLCRRLDRRIEGAARALGFVYTRYADDLTFSAKGPGPHDAGKMLRRVHWLVEQEGFSVHPDKTRVLRRGRRQEVTGVVVNERPSIERATLRRFRAFLFQLEKDGPAGKTWGQSADVFAAAIGFANYVAMVDPVKGKALLAQARAAAAKHGWKPAKRPKPVETITVAAAPIAPAAAPAAPPISAPPAPTPAAPRAAPAPAPPEAPKPPDEPPPKKKWWKLF